MAAADVLWMFYGSITEQENIDLPRPMQPVNTIIARLLGHFTPPVALNCVAFAVLSPIEVIIHHINTMGRGGNHIINQSKKKLPLARAACCIERLPNEVLPPTLKTTIARVAGCIGRRPNQLTLYPLEVSISNVTKS